MFSNFTVRYCVRWVHCDRDQACIRPLANDSGGVESHQVVEYFCYFATKRRVCVTLYGLLAQWNGLATPEGEEIKVHKDEAT